MENKKQIMIGVLSVIVCIMAVGYAYLSQQLQVNGTAHIDSTWDVAITSITPGTPVGGALDVPYNSTTAANGTTVLPAGETKGSSAQFETSLTQPGDSLTYTVTVQNNGTLPAGLAAISGQPYQAVYKNATGQTISQNVETDAIIYTISGLSTYMEIPAKNGNNPGEITFTVTATYRGTVTAQPTADQLTKSLVLTLNFVQDMHPVDTTQN